MRRHGVDQVPDIKERPGLSAQSLVQLLLVLWGLFVGLLLGLSLGVWLF